MPHVAPYDATARKTDLPTSPPSPLLAMMCGNVAGNVTPPTTTFCQPSSVTYLVQSAEEETQMIYFLYNIIGY